MKKTATANATVGSALIGSHAASVGELENRALSLRKVHIQHDSPNGGLG